MPSCRRLPSGGWTTPSPRCGPKAATSYFSIPTRESCWRWPPGTPPGAEFPAESRGILAFPHRWQPMYTRASMAMGYEFAVTPVQLAAAYAAIANDGVLLAPTLVREVREPTGKVLYRHRPEPVRRVVTPELAAQLREFLREASGEGGTGELAQLANYSVLGKTGTAIRFVGGR